MLLMRSSETHEYLDGEHALQWNDITGKELRITEKKTETGAEISLDLKQDGNRKTSDALVTLATITVPEEVKAKYADDDALKPTIHAFVKTQTAEKIAMVQHLIDIAMNEGGPKVVDMTGITPVTITFAVRIDRDEEDNEIGQTVTAQVDENAPLNYSNAGLFE